MVESRRLVKVKQLAGQDIDLSVSPDVSDYSIFQRQLKLCATLCAFRERENRHRQETLQRAF